jgi:hypothetical protein
MEAKQYSVMVLLLTLLCIVVRLVVLELVNDSNLGGFNNDMT